MGELDTHQGLHERRARPARAAAVLVHERRDGAPLRVRRHESREVPRQSIAAQVVTITKTANFEKPRFHISGISGSRVETRRFQAQSPRLFHAQDYY